MSKALLSLSLVLLAAGMLCGQDSVVLPADRLKLANQLAARGMHAEAVKEYEGLAGAKGIAEDEVAFRLAEGYRHLGRSADALRAYEGLAARTPGSRYADYAILNAALLSSGEKRRRGLASLDRDSAPVDVRQAALYYLGEDVDAASDAVRARTLFDRAAELAPKSELARLARLKNAALLAASADSADRRRALSVYLDLAASKDPALALEAQYLAGTLSYREGRYGEAAALFGRLLREKSSGPRIAEAKLYAAWSNHLSGKYAEALRLATSLAGDDVYAEDAAYLTAAALRLLERRDEAVAAYTDALKTHPRGKYADRAWFERYCLYAADDSRKALADLAARGDPPADVAGRVFSIGCDAAMSVTNLTLALQYARRAMNDPAPETASRALYLAGVVESRLGHSDDALASWTALLARHPDSPYALDALNARAMEEIRRKDFKAADRSLAELARRAPARAQRAELLYWWGVAARGSDDLPEAERRFRAALAARPTPEFAREIELELAFILQRRGEESESTRMLLGLVDSKAVDRLPSATLARLAESTLAASNHAAAVKIAGALIARRTDPTWTQIAYAFSGLAREGRGELDAAAADYRRALAVAARTDAAAEAALRLGALETAAGRHDEARKILTDAVNRSQSEALLGVRARAYAALAANEDACGDRKAALGYYMATATLFDDAALVPPALTRAAAILREQGRTKEADDLDAERRKRYGK